MAVDRQAIALESIAKSLHRLVQILGTKSEDAFCLDDVSQTGELTGRDKAQFELAEELQADEARERGIYQA